MRYAWKVSEFQSHRLILKLCSAFLMYCWKLGLTKSGVGQDVNGQNVNGQNANGQNVNRQNVNHKNWKEDKMSTWSQIVI